MVNFKKQVWLFFDRGATVFAGVMISLFDMFAELAGHKSTLAGSTLFEFDFFRKINDKAAQVVQVHHDIIFGGSIAAGADILEFIFGEIQGAEIDFLETNRDKVNKKNVTICVDKMLGHEYTIIVVTKRDAKERRENTWIPKKLQRV